MAMKFILTVFAMLVIAVLIIIIANMVQVPRYETKLQDEPNLLRKYTRIITVESIVFWLILMGFGAFVLFKQVGLERITLMRMDTTTSSYFVVMIALVAYVLVMSFLCLYLALTWRRQLQEAANIGLELQEGESTDADADADDLDASNDSLLSEDEVKDLDLSNEDDGVKANVNNLADDDIEDSDLNEDDFTANDDDDLAESIDDEFEDDDDDVIEPKSKHTGLKTAGAIAGLGAVGAGAKALANNDFGDLDDDDEDLNDFDFDDDDDDVIEPKVEEPVAPKRKKSVSKRKQATPVASNVNVLESEDDDDEELSVSELINGKKKRKPTKKARSVVEVVEDDDDDIDATNGETLDDLLGFSTKKESKKSASKAKKEVDPLDALLGLDDDDANDDDDFGANDDDDDAEDDLNISGLDVEGVTEGKKRSGKKVREDLSAKADDFADESSDLFKKNRDSLKKDLEQAFKNI